LDALWCVLSLPQNAVLILLLVTMPVKETRKRGASRALTGLLTKGPDFSFARGLRNGVKEPA
jgi:hypothetical protein